jgi:hypothetical protein
MTLLVVGKEVKATAKATATQAALYDETVICFGRDDASCCGQGSKSNGKGDSNGNPPFNDETVTASVEIALLVVGKKVKATAEATATATQPFMMKP